MVLPLLVALIGIAASFFLFHALRAAVEDLAQLRFERQAADAKGVIEGRIQSYADVLYGLKALFATHSSVNRVQFHRFVSALDLKSRYAGFDVVNFAAYVPAADLERFVESVRSDTSLSPSGYPDFMVKPPGERPEYFVLAYVEPMAGYEFAFGRDLGANPEVPKPEALAAAMRAARDSGKLTASGLPIRIRAQKEYIGLAMRLPVYRFGMPADTVAQRRAAYVGSVGAGFNIEALMKGVLNEKTLGVMRFRLYDAGPASNSPDAGEQTGGRLLFDSAQLAQSSAPGPANAEPQSILTHMLPMEVGGRVWQLHFRAPKQSIMGVDVLLPWTVFTGGIISSVLLCGVLVSLMSSRQRAMAMAQEMTKDLAESRALLNDAQKLSHVGCCLYNPADRHVIWSEELYRIHGVDPGSFVPTYSSSMELVHPQDRVAWEKTLMAALVDGEPFTTEFRIIRPDGAVRHLRSLGEVMRDGSGEATRILWSVLDITEQKQTEAALRGSAEQLTALSRRLVEIQETERRQLSRELHDRVGQNLTALSINLDILRTALTGENSAEHRARLADSAELLESTVDSIENVMAELRPPMLDDYGLLPALHWYAKAFSKRTGIEVRVAGDEGIERPRPEMEITLFRIAQEALTNVAKHAQAKRVDISLDHSNGHCIMTVTDDGIGFNAADAPDAQRRSGLGMVTMRERSQAVGGRFDVRAVPGRGTRVAISIP